MVDEPKLTSDKRVQLTRAELDALKAMLDAHDRGGFYMTYNAMTDSAEAGLQSRIATFSGPVGGAAMVANRFVQEAAPGYPGIYVQSQNVAEEAFNFIKSSNELSAGKITDEAFFDSAKLAWQRVNYVDYFPGNIITATSGTLSSIADAFIASFEIHWGEGDATIGATERLVAAAQLAIGNLSQGFTPGAIAAFKATLIATRFGKETSDMAGYTKVTGANGHEIYVDANGHTGATFGFGFDDAKVLAGGATIYSVLNAFALAFLPFQTMADVFNGTSFGERVADVLAKQVQPEQYGAVIPVHYTETYTSGFNGDTHTPAPIGETAGDAASWRIASTDGRDILFSESGGLDGAGGNDLLFGGAGANTLSGGDGDDIIWGRGGADKLDGGAGDDVLRGGAGGDHIKGGEGDDVLDGGDINTPAAQDNAADVLDGGEGNDYLYGGGGNDTLVGGDGVDKLYGGDGADVLVLGNINGVNTPGSVTGSEVTEGGAGTDYLVMTGAVGDTVRVGKGDAADRLLIHSDFLGLPASGGGKIGLFALLGGVNAIIPWSIDYEVIETFDQNSNIFEDEQGRSYRAYGYQDGEIGSTPSVYIGYKHYLSGGSLDIVISLPPTGDGGAPQYLQTITIDNFSNGDYGIKLELFLPFGVVLPGWYYNYSYLDSFDWDVAAAYDNAVIAISEPARDYSLTADGTFSGQGLRAAFAATPEITAENLMVAIDGKDGADTIVGNDVGELINGGAGDDKLIGNGGDDRYSYRRGDGHDTINETSLNGGNDRLKFSDINADAVTLKRVGDDIFVLIADSVDGAGDGGSVFLLSSATLDSQSGVESIQFADGTLWDRDSIVANAQVNIAPVARDDGPLQSRYNTSTTLTLASLLSNDTDVENAVLKVTSVGNAQHGGVTWLPEGNVTFMPDADYRGSAIFTYTISDGSGGTASATVYLDVQGIVGRTINGTAANNSLVGTKFDDTIYGLAGNDKLNGNGGVDRLVGGAGNDTYVVDSVGDTTIELANEGSDTVQSSISWTLGANLEKLTLTGAADTNGTGNELANVITGNIGTNTLNGGAANDVLRGMDGRDRLFGGDGNDRLDGGAGADIINGGDGIDTLEFVFATADVGVDLSFNFGKAGEALGDTYTSIENVSGSIYNDELIGDAAVNRLTGNAGDDVLNGMGGRDVLIGGAGNDVMTGGADADVFQINVGSGRDVITDFWAGQGRTDRVQFTSHQFVNFADLMAHTTNTAGGVVIAMGNDDTLTLSGILVSQLRADDFLFA